MPTELTGQRTTGVAASGTTVAITYPSTPTSGNLLVVSLAWNSGATIATAPPGWFQAAINTANANICTAIYYKVAAGLESGSYTWTLDISARSIASASEWSGLTASPLDKTNSNQGFGQSMTCGLTGTLSQADELVLTSYAYTDGRNSVTPDNGQALVTGDRSGTGSGIGGDLYGKTVSATTSVNYGGTLDAAFGNQNWAAAVATFKASAGSTVSGAASAAGAASVSAVGAATAAASGASAGAATPAAVAPGTISAAMAFAQAMAGAVASSGGNLSASSAPVVLTLRQDTPGTVSQSQGVSSQPVRLTLRGGGGSTANGSHLFTSSQPVTLTLTSGAASATAVLQTGNLKFSMCRDNRGATWTTEAAVASGVDANSSGAVWLGNRWGVLYTISGQALWKTATDPDDWTAAPLTLTGVTGRVYGLARNQAGVLCAMVNNRPVVSRDGGLTWNLMAAVSVTLPCSIVAKGHLFIIASPTGTTVRHFVSKDAGQTFQ